MWELLLPPIPAFSWGRQGDDCAEKRSCPHRYISLLRLDQQIGGETAGLSAGYDTTCTVDGKDLQSDGPLNVLDFTGDGAADAEAGQHNANHVYDFGNDIWPAVLTEVVSNTPATEESPMPTPDAREISWAGNRISNSRKKP